MEHASLMAPMCFSTPLQGQPIEIKGLTGKVEIFSDGLPADKEVDGTEQNGKRGRVQCGIGDSYLVRTEDGLSMLLAEENLSLQPIDFDVLCPLDMTSVEGAVGSISKSVLEKGYCVIQMPSNDDMRRGAMQEVEWFESDFMRPFPEFETQYLGKEATSKIVKLDGRIIEGSVGYYTQSVMDMVRLLTPVTQAFGFEPAGKVGSLMLRRQLEKSESDRLRPTPIDDYQVGEGEVQKFLDFVRRRRWCVMQIIDCDPGSSVTLSPKGDGSRIGSATIPMEADKLLIFRHDVFDYSYGPVGLKHLILQGWLMEEECSPDIATIIGTKEEVSALVGGFGGRVSSCEEVHVMSLSCIIGANGYGLEATTNLYQATTDIFIEIPLCRWDHAPYYDEKGAPGKAWCKHSGFVAEDETISFDNDFFGVTYEEARLFTPLEYGNFKTIYETLYLAGWNRQSLRGENIALSIGAGSRESVHMERGRFAEHDCERFVSSSSAVIEHMFLPMLLGLTGQATYIDTACSASNVATQTLFQELRQYRDAKKFYGPAAYSKPLRGAVAAGSSLTNLAEVFVGLSAAHMLGPTGRSKTYDMSANGYARSEGWGAKYMCLDSEMDKSLGKLVDMVGGCINQDGRSASLTAPNGPSQTALLKQSFRTANVGPLECQMTETHGTGTAIGDPIETGSVKAAVNGKRQDPIVYQAGKSLTGHLEFGAGSTGIIKNILAVIHNCCFGNCHFKEMNSNIDPSGYPALWPETLMENHRNYIQFGVSSFGFGGTNCRTEMFAIPSRGYRAISPVTVLPSGDFVTRPLKSLDVTGRADVLYTTCPKCGGSMCWLSGEADDRVNLMNGQHVPSSVRAEGASYEFCSLCYKGEYVVGGKEHKGSGDAGATVYIVGSWTNWTEYEKMTETAEGAHVHAVTLGDTRCERFVLSYGADDEQALYPIVPDGSPYTRIEGPDSNAEGKSWLIDGASRNTSIGTLYQIEFKVDANGNRCLSWEPKITEEEKESLARIVGGYIIQPQFDQGYAIAGSWANYRPQAMVQSSSDQTIWETSFKLDIFGKAGFNILRNGSLEQVIYPASDEDQTFLAELSATDISIPVMGPDANHENKRWCIVGQAGELVTVQLLVHPEALSVIAKSKNNDRVWNSAPVEKTRYYCVGSHNNWGTWVEADEQYEMIEDVYEPGLFASSVVIGEESWQEFQIIVDKDWGRILHPSRSSLLDYEMAGSFALGPHAAFKGEGLNWSLAGPMGTVYQIILDLRSEESGPSVYFKTAKEPS